MNGDTRKKLKNRRRRIRRRLRPRNWRARSKPMFEASNIQYELSDRTRGLDCGGIGAMHVFARQVGLIDAIDRHLRLLKVHLPYHESDHVLNIAYNILAGGTCLEHVELRRNDEVYLDALGAQRIPDPTTAGDFCRRFSETDIEILMEVINEVRVQIWRQQPASFFEEAIIDADGTIAATTGSCKGGMDIAYTGEWGYHPLVLSLANTQEPLYLINRSGNRPSHEGAAVWYTRCMNLCHRAGFKKVLFRGDTDFSQTQHLDGWDAAGARFLFGIDAMANLTKIAESLPPGAYKPLERPAKYTVKTEPRERPENVKEKIVREREFQNIRLQAEAVAAFAYRPGKCQTTYRIVVVRKDLSVEKGEAVLFDDVRHRFYITNDWKTAASELVFLANDRCNQENLIAQLKSGVRAMSMPVDTLLSNWAYMVMASLAWTLKAWSALVLPETGRWADQYKKEKLAVLKMEFHTFLNAFMRVPCQLIRTSRKLIFRLLSWNPWQHVFLRLVDVLNQRRLC